MIQDYNKQWSDKYGVKGLQAFFEKRLRMQGFAVSDLTPKYFEEHQRNCQQWIKDGSLKT